MEMFKAAVCNELRQSLKKLHGGARLSHLEEAKLVKKIHALVDQLEKLDEVL